MLMAARGGSADWVPSTPSTKPGVAGEDISCGREEERSPKERVE